MVSIDLNLKDILGLAEIGNIDKEKFKDLVNKFEKKDFVEHYVESFYEDSPESDESTDEPAV